MEMISSAEWFSGTVPDTSFTEFSEDWSTATAQFHCAPPEKLDTQRSGGFKVLFDYVVTSADGETEIRNLATAPIYATDNGSLFIAQHGESNVTAWTHEGWDQWSQVSR